MVVARGDNDIRSVSHGNSYYQQTPVRYLVDATHRFGGPADNDLESNPESDSE